MRVSARIPPRAPAATLAACSSARSRMCEPSPPIAAPPPLVLPPKLLSKVAPLTTAAPGPLAGPLPGPPLGAPRFARRPLRPRSSTDARSRRNRSSSRIDRYMRPQGARCTATPAPAALGAMEITRCRARAPSDWNRPLSVSAIDVSSLRREAALPGMPPPPRTRLVADSAEPVGGRGCRPLSPDPTDAEPTSTVTEASPGSPAVSTRPRGGTDHKKLSGCTGSSGHHSSSACGRSLVARADEVAS